MKYWNGKELSAKYVGDRAIAKIVNGNSIIWENWKELSGQFYRMTSNNWNGFVASTAMVGEGVSGNPFNAFDGNDGTGITQMNCNLGSTVRIDFPRPIKIRQIRYIIGATHSDEQVGTKNLTFGFFGVREDGSAVQLFNDVKNNFWNTVPNVVNIGSDELFKGLYVTKTDSLGWGWFRVLELEITKWIQKGN